MHIYISSKKERRKEGKKKKERKKERKKQTNKMTCAPREDSDQPEESLGPYLPIERTSKTMVRLGKYPR